MAAAKDRMMEQFGKDDLADPEAIDDFMPQEGDDPVDTDDGGAIVQLDKDSKIKTADEGNFYDNLAEKLDMVTLSRIGAELHELVMRDKEARADRDKQYEEGLRRTGLGNDAPGGATFNGASRVVHPMITQASIEFSARTSKELLPAEGPARSHVVGKQTTERLEKSERVAKCMNWQMTKKVTEFYADIEQGLTQESIGGAFYLRMIYDEGRRRPTTMMITVDDVWLPFAATSYHTAERITFVEAITRQEFAARIKNGMYRDVEVITPSQPPEGSKAKRANEKIEGNTRSTYNEDGLRNVFEIVVELDFEGDDPLAPDDGPAPYLVRLDDTSHEILGLVRNWEEQDETRQRMLWMEEFPFIPWRGAYPLGLIHLIGGLAATATGSLRALLDSGHINNLPTLLKLKGTNFFGQSLELQATAITEVEGSIATDDIRKLMMAVPFNPPSTVLFSLLGFVVEAGQNLIQMTFKDLEDNRDLPVGTTLALIEQGMKVLSGIHARHHRAMGRVLEILYRINRMYLTDEQVLDDTGELLAYRSDFQGPFDVAPVSDPEIFSDVQRTAQMQIVEQRSQLFPQLYDLRKVELMILKRTKIPDAEDLLLPLAQPTEMNPVNENVAMAMGRPVAAFPDQDHLAHIQVLMDFVTSPFFGQLSIMAPQVIPAALTHLKDHMIMWYLTEMVNVLEKETGKDAKDIMQYRDPDTRRELDRFLAAISPDVIASAQSQFEQLPPLIQAAQQMMQGFADNAQAQGPIDPGTAAVKAATIAAQAKSATSAQAQQAAAEQLRVKLAANEQAAQRKDALTVQKEQQAANDRQADRTARMVGDQQQDAARARTAQSQQIHEDARTAATNETKLSINAADNMTAIDIAQAEIESGERVAVKDGTSVGKRD